MIINNKRMVALISALVPLLLTACGSQPSRVEQNFGNSVRQMVRAQTANPDASANPPTQATNETDGQMLEGALEGYRGDTAQRGTVGGALDVGVGGGQ
jgi:type IV pilus biogenesis protein CpaD/CtpE